MKLLSHIDQATITNEWDELSEIRYRQILSGIDVTYTNVLIPNVLKLLPNGPSRLVVDAGCGVGILTKELIKHFPNVIGIDPSAKSIKFAQAHCGRAVDFHATSLEAYAVSNANVAGIVVANMVMMDVANLSSFIQSIRNILQQDGALIFSITHPFFWPIYMGYSQEKWFSYDSELIIRAPFQISNEAVAFESTHVHRPLEQYIKALSDSDFVLDALSEPMPSCDLECQYPQPWKFPRYLFGRAILRS